MKEQTRFNAIGSILIVFLVSLSFVGADYQYKTNKLIEQSKIETRQAQEKLDKLQTNQKIEALARASKDLYLRNQKLEEIIQTNQIYNEARDEDLYSKFEKPTYDYLKSVTVYINGELPSKRLDDGSIRIRQAWLGTGSIIKIDEEYTYILTNAHVSGQGLEPVEEIILTVKDEIYGKVKAELVKQSDKVDLAIIKVKGKLSSKQEIKKYGEVKQQDKIYSCGHYLGMEYIYTEGSAAGYTTEDRFDSVSLIGNLPSAFGCSGSAVVNQEGELVGVIYAIFNVGYGSVDTAKAIIVKVEDVKEFVENIIGGN
jgi:S1-C subfamily serine protease